MLAGQLVVLLGPSGSGKTTLLNIIGGINPATSGQVTVAGRELSGLDEDGLAEFRRASVGLVFQFFNLVPTLTPLRRMWRSSPSWWAEPPAARPCWTGRAGRPGRPLPVVAVGGEQQRVAVARALVKTPRCSSATSPRAPSTWRLDGGVLGLLHRAGRDDGRTVLIVTHNHAIAGMADRVLSLHDGRIRSDEVVAHPAQPEELQW